MKLTVGALLMVWSIFSSAAEYPEAVLGNEEGFVDLSLAIASIEKQENGSLRFTIKNTLNNARINFALDLEPHWDAKPIEDTDSYVYWGRGSVFSTGVESDAFIKALANLYGFPDKYLRFSKNISAQVVGLGSNPAQVEKEPVKMKFFFNPDGEDDVYSEVFININLNSGVLEFNEKDPEYRLPLLRSLAQ